jgi:hypothetical protein
MRVLVGVPARQRPEIFRRFLSSLFALETPGLSLSYHFIFHNWPQGEFVLREWAPPGPVVSEIYTSPHDYRVDEVTHHWTQPLILDLVAMKNRILQRVRAEAFDAAFFVDSDLVLHPKTLAALVETGHDVVAEVFWTRWTPDSPELPNAWDYDHYGFLPGSLERWRRPGVYRVAGTGACILIRRQAIERGLSYDLVPGVSWWGEDRALQLRAAVLGIPVFLDTRYPATHLYRVSDLETA